VKFRTMVADAEKNGAQWSQKEDKRVTRVGKFLRKTRLDELPQLWNVLKNDMSFVGPRPERPEFAFSNELLAKIPFYQIRHTIKPGLTGWAQIKYPYSSSIEDNLQKLQYDLYYTKNSSFILDLVIILKTIKIILSAAGR
ncbi:sugar transferase, partial [Patescibacteria group bacterium]|nr:sugar transferase [Patescibacteria group bacterium]